MENIAYKAAKGQWSLPTNSMASTASQGFHVISNTQQAAANSMTRDFGGSINQQGVSVPNTTQQGQGGNYPSSTNPYNADTSGGYYQQLLNAPIH